MPETTETSIANNSIRKLTCNKCGNEFAERKAFPGLEICVLCDAVGAAGVLTRGETKVCAGAR